MNNININLPGALSDLPNQSTFSLGSDIPADKYTIDMTDYTDGGVIAINATGTNADSLITIQTGTEYSILNGFSGLSVVSSNSITQDGSGNESIQTSVTLYEGVPISSPSEIIKVGSNLSIETVSSLKTRNKRNTDDTSTFIFFNTEFVKGLNTYDKMTNPSNRSRFIAPTSNSDLFEVLDWVNKVDDYSANDAEFPGSTSSDDTSTFITLIQTLLKG